MGIPWDGMGWDRHKLLWDGMGWDRKICPMDKPGNTDRKTSTNPLISLALRATEHSTNLQLVLLAN